jgi:hypothetical protein
MIGTFDQKLAEIAIAGLCDAELGDRCPRTGFGVVASQDSSQHLGFAGSAFYPPA